MSEKKMARLLRADEIECRVGTIYEHGLSLLLYKDARVDQKILDETYGAMGWKRSHQMIDGNLYCTVEIWDEEKKQWIAKQDVGTQSYSEKEKGQASDSFKRACVNWGIGRELYTAPFIWIPSTKADIGRKNDRFVTNERFYVQQIEYNSEKEISLLKIMNGSKQVIYDWKEKTKVTENSPVPMASEQQMKQLKKELQRTGVSMEAVLGRYCITSETLVTEDIYNKAMKDLKRTPSLRAA